MELPDLIEAHARELLGLSEEYIMLGWRRQPDTFPFTHTVVTLGIRPNVYKSGPRKGELNYNSRDKSKDRQVIFSDEEHKAWRVEWESKNGLCHCCRGTGQEWIGWSRETGARYQPCRRCLVAGRLVSRPES